MEKKNLSQPKLDLEKLILALTQGIAREKPKTDIEKLIDTITQSKTIRKKKPLRRIETDPLERIAETVIKIAQDYMKNLDKTSNQTANTEFITQQ